MSDLVNINIPMVTTLASDCIRSSDVIETEAKNLSGSILKLDDAFPGMPVAMREKFEEWRRLCNQLSEALSESHAYLNNLTEKAREIQQIIERG